MFEDFEELFTKGDGAALDLGKLSGGQDVDQILLDCLMYEDDALFASALALLERTYGQRKKLVEAVGNVTLLHQEVVPVFGNVADMSAELGYLVYLVRSFEVWGVNSRVSGPFGPDKCDAVLATCDKLNQFLFHAPLNHEEPVESGKAKALRDSNVLKSLVSGEVEGYSGTNPMADGAFGSGGEEDGEAEVQPEVFYQDVLRSMNLQTTLIEALNMDYK